MHCVPMSSLFVEIFLVLRIAVAEFIATTIGQKRRAFFNDNMAATKTPFNKAYPRRAKGPTALW